MTLESVATRLRRAGFTLVELLVAIAVIALLVGLIGVAGSSALVRGRVRETQSVMRTLEMAITQFNEEAPLGRVPAYRGRYGNYPCDELEGFVRIVGAPGIPAIPAGTGPVIGPGSASDLNTPIAGLGAIENQDIKAMVLVMRLYSPAATEILDKIPAQYRRTPPDIDEFFDRDTDGNLGPDDEPLVYFVDSWGTPFGYYATRQTGATPTPRGQLSDAFVSLNRTRPLLVSYGPNGPDQLELPLPVTMESDYSDSAINDLYNEDNVYIDESIKDRLREGD